VQWCADAEFLHPVFLASRVQDILNMHSKFALRLHYDVGSIVDIQSVTAETRRGKKKKKEEKPQRQNIIFFIGKPVLQF